MYCETVCIEITRRCNASCSHCLRGDQELNLMNFAYLDFLFSKVTSIGTLTITGGEPSLVPYRLRELVHKLRNKGVSVENFYIVTNGVSSAHAPFLEAVHLLYMHCHDNSISQLVISKDHFHPFVSEETKKSVLVYRYGAEREFTGLMINEGRARDNGLGSVPATNEGYVIETFNNVPHVSGCIYLNCKGNILNCPDLSYESQNDEDNIVCHVSMLDEKVLKEFAKKSEFRG